MGIIREIHAPLVTCAAKIVEVSGFYSLGQKDRPIRDAVSIER